MAIGNNGYTPKRPLTTLDVVDNLESTVGYLPLSARQGKLIANDMVKHWNLDELIRIPVNSNLNDYIEPGNYCCIANSDAETLENTPINTAFTMQVYNSTGARDKLGKCTYITQELRAFNILNGIYIRRIDNYNDKNEWTEWVRLFTTDGGTLTNNLTIERDTWCRIYLKNKNTGDVSYLAATTGGNAVYIGREANGDKPRTELYVSCDEGLEKAVFLNYDNSEYKIFGEHNKPSGSYTGNGDATSRAIITGGIGDAICVRGNGYTFFVGYNGGIGIQNNATDPVGFGKPAMSFLNGVLTLQQNNILNANGIKYNYQVY